MSEKIWAVVLVPMIGIVVFMGLMLALVVMEELAEGYLRLVRFYFKHFDASQAVIYVVAVAIAAWFEFGLPWTQEKNEVKEAAKAAAIKAYHVEYDRYMTEAAKRGEI